MWYASPIVQKIKKKNTSHVEEASVAFIVSKREIKTKEINCFIHDRDPKYELWAKKMLFTIPLAEEVSATASACPAMASTNS